jgi:uncharacterized phage protein gp47/JayE
MSYNQPVFLTSDDQETTNLVKTTSMQHQTLKGRIGENVQDIQINLNGSGFQSNADLVTFEDQSFTIPNLDVLPEGLRLNTGVNTIDIRSIKASGVVSSVTTAKVDVVRSDQLDVLAERPSGLRIRRQENEVEVVWAENQENTVRGYHIYASSQSGGGTEGYRRINPNIITSPSFTEERVDSVGESEVEYQSNQGALHQVFTEETFSGEEIQSVSNSFLDTSLTSGTVRVQTQVDDVSEDTFYSFTHNRNDDESTINNEFFSNVPDSEPLFYTVTAVGVDPNTGDEIESPRSEELVGLPLDVTSGISEPPRKDRFDIAEEYVDDVHRFDDEVSLIPGSVSRDLFVDPFSSEAQRLYFLADFIRRSQAFPTLLQIDDNPSYKEALESALGVGAGSDIQNLIDDSFDKLAANVNVHRKEATPANGDVVFYTNTEPDTDLVVPEGTIVSTAETDGDTVTFRVTSRQTLMEDQLESHFNSNRERWEITAPVQAEDPGKQGNVSAGTVTSVVGGGVSGLQVENTEAFRFGEDEEDNQSLAERAMLALSSVDSGTKQGYLSTALSIPGVVNADVVDAGHPLMMRDYDTLREEHIGGKVDVWVQGENLITVDNVFTLDFETNEDVTFFLYSDPSDLIFVTNDSEITPSQPITSLLGETPNEQSQGFSFVNTRTGDTFNLTGYDVLDYNRIQLNTDVSQPSVDVNDTFEGDVRFVRNTSFEFQDQPVIDVNSVESDDRDLSLREGDNYQVVQREDPLLSGKSAFANNRLDIQVNQDIPAQDFQINDETQVLIGEEENELQKIGVQESSIRVFNQGRTVEYSGPTDTEPDFFIADGSQTTPTRISRVPEGDIENGEEVSVDYRYDENFVVNYTVNDLLNTVQSDIDDQRHVTADVITKQSLARQVDIEMTVVLRSNVQRRSQIDASIKTRISQVVNEKGIGEDIHQSDVVQAVESVQGVSHVIMPLTQMTLSEGNLIVREDLSNASTFVEASSGQRIYLLREGLNYDTYQGGRSDQTVHRGVFKNSRRMDVVDSYTELTRQHNRALIIGDEGIVIDGFTDDQTLSSNDDTLSTPEEQEERRRELTAHHVLISLESNDHPSNHSFGVSYHTKRHVASKSTIPSSSISHLELGSISITYRES